ncbi:MAG: hypothetical protein CVV27_15985 [Candidatus Melainabacteria bacterium HGW-Melainabacteria-1]|nr:MAG: hypothetical protein CVV27_15985 [Candidatus Melainabacteria bacterium HGW-Melainabacteria-1]
MTTLCPHCRLAQTLSTPDPETRLEYCPGCGMAWLAFGRKQPQVYAQLETQLRQWEERLARRQDQTVLSQHP